jgi:molybdopterin converting factor small subunit
MKIYIEWIGLLHIHGTKNHSFIDLKNNATISNLYDQIKIKKEHQKFISSFVNGTEKKMFSVLKDGDKVKLFLPTGGG